MIRRPYDFPQPGNRAEQIANSSTLEERDRVGGCALELVQTESVGGEEKQR
jgi:hypothetical protein